MLNANLHSSTTVMLWDPEYILHGSVFSVLNLTHICQCSPPATQRLLRLFVCCLRQHTSEPASSDQMCHSVQPGRVLSQRCSTAGSPSSNKKVSITGTWGNTVLTGRVDCHLRIFTAAQHQPIIVQHVGVWGIGDEMEVSVYIDFFCSNFQPTDQCCVMLERLEIYRATCLHSPVILEYHGNICSWLYKDNFLLARYTH